MKPSEFVKKFKDMAKRVHEKTGIPWEVMLAQAALETGWGSRVSTDRVTGKYSYNLFNIKGEGPNGFVEVMTTEYYRGKPEKVIPRFRAYHNFEESFEDYAKLITKARRYKPAMAVKDNPEEFARQLQKCGYATDPRYADKLISVMRTVRKWADLA